MSKYEDMSTDALAYRLSELVFEKKKLETIKYPTNFEEQKLRDLKREIKSAKRHLATRQTRMKGF